jgi:hypothetical protein
VEGEVRHFGGSVAGTIHKEVLGQQTLVPLGAGPRAAIAACTLIYANTPHTHAYTHIFRTASKGLFSEKNSKRAKMEENIQLIRF